VSVSGTGGLDHRVEAFLGTPGSPCYPSSTRLPVTITPHLRPTHEAGPRIYLGTGLRAWTGQAIRPAGLPLCVTPVNTLAYQHGGSPDHQPHQPHPPHMVRCGHNYGPAAWVSTRASAWSVLRRYGNINPSSIDYACRPRL